jgi:hypothetical protein
MTLENARGESIGDNIYALDEATEQKGPNVGRETICRDGDDPEIKSAALLVLMTALENGRIPQGGREFYCFNRTSKTTHSPSCWTGVL